MSAEQWREIPGTGGLYEASSHGRIRSRHFGRVHVLSANLNQHGYLFVTVCVDGMKLNRRVHQLVAAAFLGPRPDGQIIRHLDGDKLNNLPSNLRYGTDSDNAQDSVEHGTHGQLRKTHCPRGHAYDETNTRIQISQSGAVSRRCRACHRAAVAAAYRTRQQTVQTAAILNIAGGAR